MCTCVDLYTYTHMYIWSILIWSILSSKLLYSTRETEKGMYMCVCVHKTLELYMDHSFWMDSNSNISVLCFTKDSVEDKIHRYLHA